ncbi:glycosyltransferase family 25 protein [Mesorhizobium marinum]|uniref:glycosyltransferase family 25 protein n=1 Tax=Mesorhizobium marinum TaxID=3228790 RepID=UPI003467539B
MLAYYINLDSRPDRRAFMEKQFAALGLEVERLPATTPESIRDEDIAPHSMTDLAAGLSPAEIAISVSHFRIWKRMLDKGQPCALVLEDDVLLSARLPEFLAAVERADADEGILKIETRMTEVQIHRRAEPGAPGFDYHLPLSFEPGSAAYIITAACAARILSSPQRLSLPVDLVLFSPISPLRDPSSLRVAVPALAVNRPEISSDFDVPESILASDAEAARLAHISPPHPKMAKMPVGVKKVWREFRRLAHQPNRIYRAIQSNLASRTTIIPLADRRFGDPRSTVRPRP